MSARGKVWLVIGLALPADGLRIGGEEPGRHRRSVDQGNNSIDRNPGAHLRPIEGADQRLGKSQTRGLDDNMLGRLGAFQQALYGRQKIVRHGATDTTVGQLQDIALSAAFDPAAFKDFAVDTQVAELVNYQGDTPAARMRQDVPYGARLPRAEEAGDDGRRYLACCCHGPLFFHVIHAGRDISPIRRPCRAQDKRSAGQ